MPTDLCNRLYPVVGSVLQDVFGMRVTPPGSTGSQIRVYEFLGTVALLEV